MAGKAGRRSNGEGTVYQRPDGLWCAQITVGLKPNGTPDRKSIYGKTKAIVLEKKRQAEAKVTTGMPLERQNLTVETLMEEYLKDSAPTLRPKTIHSYAQLSRVHIVPRLGAVKVTRLDARQVQHWQQELLASGLSGQSVNLARQCLSRALDMAMRYDWIGRNVVQSAKAPSVTHRATPELGQEEATKILATFAGHRFEGIVWLLIGCGLRIGEALGACWGDLDMERRLLTVRHQLARATGGNTGAFILSSPKTKKGHRVVALPLFVVESLQRQHRAQLDGLRDVTEAGETWGNEWGLIFTCGMGQPLAHRNVLRQFHAVLGRVGMPEVTQHDLRHLHASLLNGQGIEMKAISDALGHSQIGVTDRYTHALRGANQRIAGAIEAAVAKPPTDSKPPADSHPC